MVYTNIMASHQHLPYLNRGKKLMDHQVLLKKKKIMYVSVWNQQHIEVYKEDKAP